MANIKEKDDNILEVRNLNKEYSNFKLKDINLSLPKGMIMGLIGENGAGKTTTIKSILNLTKVSSGEVKIFGLNIKEDETKIKEDIGVVLADSFFSEYLTAEDINQIMKNIYENWDEHLFFKFLVDFNLKTKQEFKEFSSGMKVKLKIATALSHHPKLLVLDEPTSGLDPIARSEILDIFQDFIENGENSILVSSHITSDLEHIADYITFISDGKILLSKTRDELLEEYGIVRCTEEEFKKIDKKDYLKYKKNKYEYDVLVENKREFKKKYDFKVIDKPRLDDIMLMYIKGSK